MKGRGRIKENGMKITRIEEMGMGGGRAEGCIEANERNQNNK